ncbi:MAG: hypothetical protein WBG92_21940 [Thiohalocapsa sp.]
MTTPDPRPAATNFPAYPSAHHWRAYILASGPDRKYWENRLWTRYMWPRYRGPLLIHASKWWSATAVAAQMNDVAATWEACAGRKPALGVMPGFDTLRKIRDLGMHIVGCVDIVPGRDAWESAWVSAGGACPQDHCALRLENPRPLPEPIPSRGQLGLFRFSANQAITKECS